MHVWLIRHPVATLAEEDPSACAMNPRGRASQLVALVVVTNCPTSQSLQELWPDAFWYLPGTQNAHATAPPPSSSLFVVRDPGAHASHGVVRFCLSEAVPFAHDLHAACPDSFWNWPGMHGRHEDWPAAPW